MIDYWFIFYKREESLGKCFLAFIYLVRFGKFLDFRIREGLLVGDLTLFLVFFIVCFWNFRLFVFLIFCGIKILNYISFFFLVLIGCKIF